MWMKKKIHPNFKSLNPSVTNIEKISKRIGEALRYQSEFEKKTSPSETKNEWKNKELRQSFKINLAEIDRLYYIHFFNHGIDREFRMIARMDQNNHQLPLYVKLEARCDYDGFEKYGSGYIYISRDVSLFMNLVIVDAYNKDDILKSLAQDGIKIKKYSSFHDERELFQEAVESYLELYNF